MKHLLIFTICSSFGNRFGFVYECATAVVVHFTILLHSFLFCFFLIYPIFICVRNVDNLLHLSHFMPRVLLFHLFFSFTLSLFLFFYFLFFVNRCIVYLFVYHFVCGMCQCWLNDCAGTMCLYTTNFNLLNVR